MAKRNKMTEEFSVDQLMSKVTSTLVRDFQTNFNDPSFCSEFQRELSVGTIARIREVAPAPDCQMLVDRYKATYQLQSVLKRYRYQNDIYDDKELTQKAIDGFLATQSRLAHLDLSSLDLQSQRVLDLAAKYVSDLLGPYSDEEHRDLCRFGRKASVGVPARLACEAARWQLPVSGSSEQISWFDSEMSQIASVQDYWAKQRESDPEGSTYQEVCSLTLSLVPKTFKSLRAIMPNTTIGSYMSFGLGEMIRKRLRRKGYNIKTLQQRHRYLAQQASVNNLFTTADLSSASDSITVALVERLFPPDWFKILNQSRIDQVVLPDGVCVESLTFCTMGIGYTFPLQTLVFLSLLKAIEASLYSRLDRRTISVYGDDMIYSSRMHNEVVHFFEQFGFVINVDKTFSTGHFRESCGGDYYHGVDVRPFQPRNGSANVGRKAYEAILYKYTNGLLARWSEHEIGLTLNFLMSELEALVNKVKIVPGDFPDDSGVKCPTLTTWSFLSRTNCAHPKHVGHGIFRFSFLRLVPDDRKEVRHDPYLWLGLRGGLHSVDFSTGASHQELPGIVRIVNQLCGIQDVVSPFKTKEDIPIMTFRSKLTGRRLRRSSTYVTVSHSGRYTRQSGTSCFEDRR